jgi:hypothetical protein
LWSRAVCLLLGANLWLVVFLIPTWRGGGETGLLSSVVAALPWVPLALGVALGSATWLLGIFPSTLALVCLAAARSAAGGAYLVSGGGFALAAISLAGYLLLVSASLEWEKRPSFDPSNHRRFQGGHPITSQWRRRRRVYAYLLAATVVFPALLMYLLNVHEQSQAVLAAAYEERAGRMKVLINVGLAAFWTLVFFAVLRHPLHLHQKGDGLLRRQLREHRSGKRGPAQAIAALSLAALGLLALFWAIYGFGGG